MEERLKEVLCKVFELEVSEINEEVTPDMVALWDSLHHLKMVTAIESVFGIRLTMREIRGMTTFGKIREAVESHLEEGTEPTQGTPIQGNATHISRESDGE